MNSIFKNLVIEAEETIYKKVKVNTTVRKGRIVWGFLMIMVAILSYLNYCWKGGEEILILLVICGISTLVYINWEKYQNRKHREILTERYKKDVLKKWKQLLSDERWNLYNINGIQWVITVCERKIEQKSEIEKLSDFLKKICKILVIPILTVIFSQIIEGQDMTVVMKIGALFIAFVIFLIGIGLVVWPIISMPNEITKNQYESIRDDMEYVLVKLQGR